MKLLRKATGYAIVSACFALFMSAIITAHDQSNFLHVMIITTAWVWALGIGGELLWGRHKP